MNRNPSQFSRTAIGLFFVLFFTGIAQASNFQKIARSLPDIAQPKVDEVFGVLNGLGIGTNHLHKDEIRVLVRALDDPTHLIENSTLSSGSFGSAVSSFYHTKRSFFFARFDLQKDSDGLFTKLFTKKSGEKLEELPLQEAERNWENFLDEVKKSNLLGYTQIEETDLEAAAMSFVHQRFSDKYFPSMDRFGLTRMGSRWPRESLGMFFHRKFNIGHYMSPNFTLTPEDFYYQLLMFRIQQSEFFKLEENFALLSSKEFVLKIWNDATEEIRAMGAIVNTSDAFLGLTVYFSVGRSVSSSMDGHLFLKALEEAARENDRLAQLVNIVDDFVAGASRNQENYTPYILQKFIERQFIEMSGLEEDMIHNLLYHQGLLDENFTRSQLRQSDPADAGAHL